MVDLTAANYFIAAVVIYYAVLLLVAKLRRHVTPVGGEELLFVVIVPARNEELVLDATLRNLDALDYGDYRVLVMNDGSADATSAIAHRFAASSPRVVVVDRDEGRAGRGKSDVLNHGVELLTDALRAGDPRFPSWTDDSKVVIGIVDADGRLQADSLRTVAPYFSDPAVGSVQVGVRIGNAGDGLLARMQDLEFVGFTYLVQVARDHFGSSGLGGNGQFARLSALLSIGRSPWATHALTEDLELGLSLVERGWRTRFCPATFVSQQGLNHWRPLLRQRTRWIHGHYQCWKHVPKLLLARGVSLGTRFDLVAYLLLVVTVVVVTLNTIATILAATGLLTVENNFLGFVPGGYLRALSVEAFALFPLAIFMWTYQVHSGRPFRWYELPAYSLAFTLYSYVWIISTARAWTRLVTRRGNWTKTPRVAVAAQAEA